MGKISKTMQPKHRETLSPWLRDYVESVSSAPLPLIRERLARFPSKWSFPRGDLYHWIPLLNRFDDILESFCATYQLKDGPQMRDFGCDLLLNTGAPVDYREQAWGKNRLVDLGYQEDGDCQLIVAVLKFTRMLLEHCGNRSIYASSAHLNDLLNSTNLKVIRGTLEVGLELAQRYQASVKRMASPSRQVSSALLASHYNIDLERVHQLAQPFVKTPLHKFSDAPGSSSKKEKSSSSSQKNVASMYANDLVGIAASEPNDNSRWDGWGDVKILYYPNSDAILPTAPVTAGPDRSGSTAPATPTPLRRSTSMTSQTTPRSARQNATDDSPHPRTPAAPHEEHTSGPKSLETSQVQVLSTSTYELLARCPSGMPKHSRYEFLHRLRISKALLGGAEDRQLALAVRLLATTNLAYIHPEPAFIERALKQDNDEPRRYQLVYQLAELIHPSSDGSGETPLWLQSIALSLLEGISAFPAKYSDVLSALNANVNHGVLLYVIRKAVAGMKDDAEDVDDEKMTAADEWRNNLFSLTLHMAMSSRIGHEMITAGLMEILVDILNLRSRVASRNHSMVLAFLDGLIYGYQGAFASFSGASGLDSIAALIVDSVTDARALIESGGGTKPELRTHLVDYHILYHHQQTLKWLLKFVHHVMSNSYSYGGGNTDRLLRNLVDDSRLLASLRSIIEDRKVFGSVVWTNAATLLSDFINNDPTSFTAISESGLINGFLESVTGKPVSTSQPPEQRHGEMDGDNEESGSSAQSDAIFGSTPVAFESDERPHPPSQEMLDAEQGRPLAPGILASSEAIGVIPTVLNSICLNNTGMQTVVSSRALDTFLEIFESPEHVQCMEVDPDLANTLGNSFDELARHHPSLRPAISNAILDMVARVVHLGRKKWETTGWGAKLLVVGPSGNHITADRRLLDQDSLKPKQDGKGKQVATSGDMDVDMVDASMEETAPEADVVAAKPASATGPQHEITPYVSCLAVFLNAATANSTLKSSFIRDGGIELLFDLMESPSLPHDFCELPPARLITQVVATLTENSHILTQPSLLNRVQANVDMLKPLVHPQASFSFFESFINPDESLLDGSGALDLAKVENLSKGTEIVKALLNLQVLIKVLYSSFPYMSRQSITTLPAVNVYDYYVKLIRSLGPLLRGVLTQEMGITSRVPQHWVKTQPDPSSKSGDATSLGPLGSVTSAGAMDRTDGALSVTSAGTAAMPSQPKKLTPEEQSTAPFLNFKTLRLLLHTLMPSTFPFFQSTGKALLQRRDRDRSEYVRSQHIRVAEALAETVLGQLKPLEPGWTIRNLHHWIIMLHTVHEMLIDKSRNSERSGSGTSVIVPVLLAFKEHGGIGVLTSMIEQFLQDMHRSPSEVDTSKTKAASEVALKKVLEIVTHLVHGKTINDCFGLTSIKTERRQEDLASQLLVELRMSVLPVIRKLWDSGVVEKSNSDIARLVVDILKTIAKADIEAVTEKGPLPVIFKGCKPVRFNWSLYTDPLRRLEAVCDDQDLRREAMYRALGKEDDAREYCRAHRQNLAGKRNPVPEEDAFSVEASAQEESRAEPETPASIPDLASDPMPLDHPLDLDQNMDQEAVGEASGDISMGAAAPLDESNDRDHDDSSQDSNTPAVGMEVTGTTVPAPDPQSRFRLTKTELDKERAALYKDLIDPCLDVIRAHPDLVFEISELIQNTLGHGPDTSKRTEIAETLAHALLSFAVDEGESRKAHGKSIAAYAHLLSLLLQDKAFYRVAGKILRDSVGDYLGFLSLPPASSNEEVPPWIPYILLIFEILLADDEQPVEVTWRAPTSEDAPVDEPIWQVKEYNLTNEHRASLLSAIVDMLPRIGKEEPLAVSILRILVVLTRDHNAAKTIGERMNLQRLFVMAKQLCGVGSARLHEKRISDNISIILRHIIEDEETIRQLMQYEIRFYMEGATRHPRHTELSQFLRSMASTALRSPKIFVEVATDMLKLARWQPPGSGSYQLVLKESRKPASESAEAGTEGSVEPTVQATEDLTINDVKPSTELGETEGADPAKTPAQDSKRPLPILENPDGVVHFLLCELVNYREVEDKDPSAQIHKESASDGPSASGSASSAQNPRDHNVDKVKDKEKKPSKPQFKVEDHPIFVYRCFLLNCLSELLQGFNRAKMEFINFKRGTQVQPSMPIKPRSSVLNYLINDLLCLNFAHGSLDSIALKKKAATSAQAQGVLVSLVGRTCEKTVDRSRDQFEYDDDSDLLFVRRFVLDTILRAYKDASTSEPVDARYSKMLCLAELMSHMIGEKDKESASSARGITDPSLNRSHMQLKRLMYEKGYLATLTASIAEIDLTFPNVKRTVKYILRVLRTLSKTAILLSQSDILPSAGTDVPDDELASASSMSEPDDDREETPDLYRNSSLGLLESGLEEDFSEDSDEDEEMYDETPYDDELDYGEEMSPDGEEDVSDEDEDLEEMGDMEGHPGNPGVVEVIMGENDDDDDDDGMEEDDENASQDEDDDEDDEEVGSEDMEELEDRIEVVGEDGQALDDDGGSGWESDTDDEDGDEDEEIDYEAQAQDINEAQMVLEHEQLGHFTNILRTVVEGDGVDRDDFEGRYIDIDDGGEEDEEEEEDMEDEEFYFDPGYAHNDHPPPNMPAGLGWDTLVVEPNHRHHRGVMRSPFPAPFMIGSSHRDPLGDYYRGNHPLHRSSRPTNNNPDLGINPLLRRNTNPTREPPPRPPAHAGLVRIGFPGIMAGNLSHLEGSPLSILNDLMQSLPLQANPRGLTFQIGGARGEVRELNMPPVNSTHQHREARPDERHAVVHEPQQAVYFVPTSTFERWEEEAHVVFGSTFAERTSRLYNAMLGSLAPIAIQLDKDKKVREAEEKRKKEEERQKRDVEEKAQREARETEEKAAREKKEAEERAEREAAEAAAAVAAAAAAAATAVDEVAQTAIEVPRIEIHGEEDDVSQDMEGVEAAAVSNAATEAETQRITTTIRGGETVDVTDLGIDPDYLAALPEEFREEVIAQTVSTRRSQAREQADAEGENPEVFQEFLMALPDELRVEILQQERQERRRRERDEQRRQAAAAGGQDIGPADMDPASILLTFPPELRNQVLLEQGDELMEHLPPDLAAEARAMSRRHHVQGTAPPANRQGAAASRPAETSAALAAKSQRRTVVQMLEKAGIATLLRLMFVTQHGSIRNYLFELFCHVCENKMNRMDVVYNLLKILQEGSIDMDAVERSFSQLSLRAKQPRDKDVKTTPNGLKRASTALGASTHVMTNSDISPLLVVQQCLDLLVELSAKIPSITTLFLMESEIAKHLLERSSISRKGKAKDVNSKAPRYAINSLLNLLDRPLVMESSSVMQLLADLLNKVTYPLQSIERRRKEAEEEAKKKADQPDAAEGASATHEPDTADHAMEGGASAESSTAKPPPAPEKKLRPPPPMPPTIPDHSLKLVINVFVARECSSKTFQNTISTIKNLSSIPNAKHVFGEELVRQARLLSANIVSDLDDLLPHILKAESGTEIQGVALAKFSPGASEQNKLLRVLTALDHLFDSKKKSGSGESEDTNDTSKEGLLASLYWNATFGTMWEKLGACLSAIRKRENMLNVATILLPLIEALMVVCKNTSLSDAPAPQVVAKELLLSSPPPESRMAGLFFSFTEEHRRILNELVRHNPKLMSGTFSLLVKNPKVLEFDNKRNYFNRSVHSKSGHQQARPSFPPLQLSVRREHVFHDSFKSLYFKSGDEMKFGKLNIRFHGEEGVDAGGVTREWFQVLARQMFDPNYALFIPVSSDRTTFHPNKLSGVNDEHLMFFKFIGRVIGKALYEGRLLDCYFSRAVYKRILGKPVSVKDMESFDPEYYKSLVWMLENDITDILVENFCVEDDEFGVTKIVDLVPDGRNVVVTEDNKHEYVRLIVEHKLLTSVKDQMENFLKGFHDIIPADLIAIFNEQELELLISGLPDIDVDDWKSNTEYHNYTAASQQIQWFWRAIRSFDKEERAKLLQFVTGTSKVPLNGFKELEGMNGVNRFNIHRDYGKKERLPSSHTCFNQLDIPEYESYDVLRSQILKAITTGSDYFGFA